MTSPVGKDERGFSLLELLVVLLLISLAGAIVLPAMDRGLRGREVRQSALRVAAVARNLRYRALSESTLERLIFNPVENSYQASPGQTGVLSSEAKITAMEGGEPLEDGRRQYLFFPNGSLLGGAINISAGETSSSYWVRLDSLTGRVVVERGGRE